MENIRKIKNEIKMTIAGVQVKEGKGGLLVYPIEENAGIIYSTHLRRLVQIAQNRTLGCYVNFAEGYIRLY